MGFKEKAKKVQKDLNSYQATICSEALKAQIWRPEIYTLLLPKGELNNLSRNTTDNIMNAGKSKSPNKDLHKWEEEASESDKDLSRADRESTEPFMSSGITVEHMQLIQELLMEL